MRAIQLPYRQARNAVVLEPWQLMTAEGAVPLPEVHPAWDSSVDVAVSREIALDADAFASETGIGEGAQIRLVAGYYCENARSRSFPWKRDIQFPSGYRGSAGIVAPAHSLASSVELIVGAILMRPGKGQSAIAAKINGSWLWVDRVELRLEGSSGRFPMEWSDFKKSGLPPTAGWFLDWPSQDWEAPLLGALRLRLNAAHPLLSKVLALPDQDPRRRIVIQSAMLDVAKQLIVTALISEEFVSDADAYPEASVGYCIRLLIRTAFPNEGLPTVRDRLRHQAGEFHAQLQDGLDLFNFDIGT